MNKTRLYSYSYICILLLALPSCGGKQKVASKTVFTTEIKQEDNPLATNMDILGDASAQKLVEQGITTGGQPSGKSVVRESSELLEEKKPSVETQLISPVEQTMVANGLQPSAPSFIEGDDTIEFNFENADLEQLVSHISSLYGITFISDDSIQPVQQGAKVVKGNKISFKTQQPLSRKDAWNLFVTFLDLAGLALVPESNPKFMRITSIDTARKSALPSFIGVPIETLPDNDQIIRYVYFVENTSVETIKSIVDSLRSSNSALTVLQEMKAFVLTDKAYNIKSLMNIVKELDKVVLPQSMSVLKLRRVDANDVKKLYETLIGADEKTAAAARLFPQLRKQPSSQYFPENTRIIPEPRTNSLILLGPIDAIRRMESFIMEYIDTPIDQPYSPLFVLPLRYADAATIANIMNEVTQFGKSTEAGKTGGVRNGDKFFRPIHFTPEPETNRIVVKGDYEDFLRAKEIVTQLDSPQPQVAIEVLLLSLTATNIQELGAVLRSREPGTGSQFFGSNVKFQTTGLFRNGLQQPVVQNPDGPGVFRLLGNLLNLVNFGTAGSTVVSLGDALSVWGILEVLQSITATEVLANPFLVATNKTKAQVALGEIRRVVTGTVIGTAPTNVFGDAPARLEIHVAPQINSDGMIILDLQVILQQFVGAANPDNAVRTERKIDTKTILADKEVLALGGLIRNVVDNSMSKVPILGDIPVLGWLFKNRRQVDAKENLLILLSAHIMRPEKQEALNNFTTDRVNEYHNTIEYMRTNANVARDPIDRWFFRSQTQKKDTTNVEDFIFRHESEHTPSTTVIVEPEKIISAAAKKAPVSQTPAHANKPITTIAKNSKKSLVELIEDEPTMQPRNKGAAT